MAVERVVITGDPYLTLAIHFWRVVRDDLCGRSVAVNELPSKLRRLPYAEKIRIEAKRLRAEALIFLTSDAFTQWARACDLHPDRLREALLRDCKDP